MGPAADGAGRREDMERRDAAHEVGMWGNFFTSTDRGIDVTENRRQYNFFRNFFGTNSANISSSQNCQISGYWVIRLGLDCDPPRTLFRPSRMGEKITFAEGACKERKPRKQGSSVLFSRGQSLLNFAR